MKTVFKASILLSGVPFFVAVQAAQPESKPTEEYPEGYLRLLPRELQEELKKFIAGQFRPHHTDEKPLIAAIQTASRAFTNAGMGPYAPAVANQLEQEAKNLENALQAYNAAPGTKHATLQSEAHRLINDLRMASKNRR